MRIFKTFVGVTLFFINLLIGVALGFFVGFNAGQSYVMTALGIIS